MPVQLIAAGTVDKSLEFCIPKVGGKLKTYKCKSSEFPPVSINELNSSSTWIYYVTAGLELFSKQFSVEQYHDTHSSMYYPGKYSVVLIDDSLQNKWKPRDNSMSYFS